MNDNYGVNAENINTNVLIQKVEGGVTIGGTPQNPPKPIDINWREICQNALAERQKLTTNPLTTGDGVEFTFDDIYVPLGLVQKVKKEKRPGEVSPEEGSQFYQPEKEYEEVTRTYKNDEFFAQVLKQGQSPKSQGRRLAVTGEPGAGKTTLLQKIAQWVAAETQQDVAIWVSLADLQGRSVEEYLQQKWLKDALGAVEVTPEMKEALALLFKSGRVWLLLDGVDEMGSSNPLATVANQISGWVASARVVVTCRQNVWDAGKNALEGFDVYRNLDFDYPQGVRQFIHRWFARYPELGKRLLAELAQAGKERIRDTVRNPLRLALLCRAWQIRQGSLPETKAGLYGQFAEALYEWKQEAFPTKSKQRKDLNAALGRLALRGMEQSESRFRLREGLVTEILGETDEPLCQLALQLGWLNLVGVAVENPDERVYAFYHPTFQEYFAALTVDDWDYFLPRNHVNRPVKNKYYRVFEKQWKEVILLWFGRGDVQKEKKEAFIEKLVNFDDGCGDWNYQKVDKGFYEYRAYFFAGIVIPEFKDCCMANVIVSQIVKYVIFLEPIAAGANVVLIETDRERAIACLIQIFDETYEELTRQKVAYSLGEIAVVNEDAIARLIQLLYEASDWLTRSKVVNSLGKIAVGNEGAIARLIQLLDETSNVFTRKSVADGLAEIAVGNEGAIARLIQLLYETYNEYTRETITDILGEIAVGNEGAIARLIQLWDETYDKYIRQTITDILGEIAVGNGGAINRLIQLLFDRTSNEDTRSRVAKSLGKIAVGNEGAINRLIQLLEESSNKYTRETITDILGEIAVGNERAINCLIQLLDKTYNKYTRQKVTETLGKIAMGNEGAINRLIQLLDENYDEYTRQKVTETLGKIAVGNEGAIARLIQLFDETSEEFIRRKLPDSLEKIGVKNEGAIALFTQLWDKKYNEKYTCQEIDNILNEIAVGDEVVFHHLIELLYSTEYYKSTHSRSARSLGKIAVGNEGAINRLIQLLNETYNEYTRLDVAHSLSKIAVAKEVAVSHLIQLLDETSDLVICWQIADILSKIAVGNEAVIARLIQLLDETSNEYTRQTIPKILCYIAVGNEGALNRLIQLLNETSNEYTRRNVAESLGNIAVGNEGALNRLIQLLSETSNKATREEVAKSLANIAQGTWGKIAYCIQVFSKPPNEEHRKLVVDLLSKSQLLTEGKTAHFMQQINQISDEFYRQKIAESLGKIAVGNQGEISHLIQLLSETIDEFVCQELAETFGKIAVGNQEAIARLIQLLSETSDEFARQEVAEKLGKIAVGNQEAIARLIQLLSEISDESTCRKVTNNLDKIIENKQQYYPVFNLLKYNLSDKIYQNKIDCYQASYKLIWQFTQNLTYAEFYKAWNYEETPVTQLTPTSTSASKLQNNLWQKLWQYLNHPIF